MNCPPSASIAVKFGNGRPSSWSVRATSSQPMPPMSCRPHALNIAGAATAAFVTAPLR